MKSEENVFDRIMFSELISSRAVDPDPYVSALIFPPGSGSAY